MLKPYRHALLIRRTEKSYRKRSLLIHPDKLKHERGIEAFDLLKKVGSRAIMTMSHLMYFDRRRQTHAILLLDSGLWRTARRRKAQDTRRDAD